MEIKRPAFYFSFETDTPQLQTKQWTGNAMSDYFDWSNSVKDFFDSIFESGWEYRELLLSKQEVHESVFTSLSDSTEFLPRWNQSFEILDKMHDKLLRLEGIKLEFLRSVPKIELKENLDLPVPLSVTNSGVMYDSNLIVPLRGESDKRTVWELLVQSQRVETDVAYRPGKQLRESFLRSKCTGRTDVPRMIREMTSTIKALGNIHIEISRLQKFKPEDRTYQMVVKL